MVSAATAAEGVYALGVVLTPPTVVGLGGR